MQFVWVYWHGGAQADELRFSVRSVVANYQGPVDVLVVGDRAPYYSGPLLRLPRVGPQPRRGYRDTLNKLHAACTSDAVESTFTWMMDDIYFVRPVTEADLRQHYHGGRVPARSKGGGGWATLKRETLERIAAEGLPLVDYCTHLPHVVDKAKFLHVWEKYGLASNVLQWELLYGAEWFRSRRPVRTIRTRVRRGGATFDRAGRIGNNSNSGWSPRLRDELLRLFPNESPYDTPLPKHPRAEIVGGPPTAEPLLRGIVKALGVTTNMAGHGKTLSIPWGELLDNSPTWLDALIEHVGASPTGAQYTALLEALDRWRPQTYEIKPGYQSRPAHNARMKATDHAQRNVYEFAARVAGDVGTVTDWGCGSGAKLVELFGHAQTLGLDVDYRIADCRKRFSDRRWGVIESVPPAPDCDLLLWVDVIEHLDDPLPWLQAIREGRWRHCIISTPERDRARGPNDMGPPANIRHTREWNAAEFSALIERHVGQRPQLKVLGEYNLVAHLTREQPGPAAGTRDAAARPPSIVRTRPRIRVGFAAVVYVGFGGTETFHRVLLPALARRSDIELVGFVSTWQNGGDVAALACPAAHGSAALAELASRVDVLVEWGVRDLRTLLGDSRCAVVSTHHGDTNSTWADEVIVPRMDWVDEILTVNPDVAARYQSLGSNAVYIPSAVGDGALPRRRVGDRRRVLWLGRFSPEKRPALALRIAAAMPDVDFRIVGGGEEAAALIEGAAALPNVVVVPPVSQPWGELSQADAFIGTSDQEGFGRSMAEAILARVPVVSTPVGLAVDKSLCEQVGVDAPAEAWATALRRAFKTKPSTLQQRREAMLTTHGVDTVAEQWSDVLHVVAERGPRREILKALAE